MSKRRVIVDASPVRREVMTPQEFVRVSREIPHLIARSRFVAPSIGRRDFGAFEVEYTVPRLKVVSKGKRGVVTA